MKELGRFITNGTESPFYARRTITIEKEIKKATAKVCGLGQFLFSINGKKASDHILDPGWTNYNRVVEYVTFDVTGYLVQGENVLGAEIGNGWYIMNKEHYTFTFPEFMPPNPNPYVPFGKSLVFAMELVIEYVDGASQAIYADENWKTKRHECIQSNVYGSETFDGGLRQHGWNQAGFDDGEWEQAIIVDEADEPRGRLIEQFQPPIRVIKTYPGVKIGEVNGREIYDFGQNISGILTLSAKGEKGDVIKVYPAEKLTAEGDADQMMKGWAMLDMVITFILGSDDVETFTQKFTYFAGKVVAIEKSSGNVEIESVTAGAITSAWKTDGSFNCDDERYNKIYDMIEKTVEANMVSVHTDCPTIERFAWQEPNHLMAPAIMFMKDGRLLWDKFLLDMRTSQHDGKDIFHDFEGNVFPAGDGLVPSQCPCYIPNVLPVPGMGSFYDIIPWGSSSILGTRWHYRFYGDVEIIKKNYDMGMRYLKHLKTKVNADGFLNHGLGDWGNPDKELARENIETAFLYADAMALCEFAQILGKGADAAELENYAKEVRENYNRKLLCEDEDGHYFYRSFEHGDRNVRTQAVEAVPVYFGLVPESAKEDVIAAFRKTLLEKGCFATGEVGLPYVIQTAREYGMNDLIASYIVKEEHPSYYAFVLAGMTTLGEYWEENPRSQCHDMMGHIIEWYYNGIAGIQPQAPGFKEVVLKPYLPESMHSFTCTYDSASGPISIAVKEKDDKIEVDIQAAEGIAYRFDPANLADRGKKIVEL